MRVIGGAGGNGCSFFCSSRRRHTRYWRDWSSDVCSSDLAALVASYDLLLGYTGSVSFAHTMFYGIGSYSIAIALYSMGPGWAAVATGIVVGLPLRSEERRVGKEGRSRWSPYH